MARVKIEEIVGHLSTELRKALDEAVRKEIPDADFNPQQLFREFRRAVRHKCSTWESVPDHYVEK